MKTNSVCEQNNKILKAKLDSFNSKVYKLESFLKTVKTTSCEDKQPKLHLEKPIAIKTWTFENFSLGKCLGKGRFGNVYAARYINFKLLRDETTKYMVALKIINKKMLIESKMVK